MTLVLILILKKQQRHVVKVEMMNVDSVEVLWEGEIKEYCVKSVRYGFTQSARKFINEIHS